MIYISNNQQRKGCIDIWNAFMLQNATFSEESDIPVCPNNTMQIPKSLIGFDEAKTIYRKTRKINPDFQSDSFIHFYIDDIKFDGKRDGIWMNPQEALNVIQHFAGIITPDFSTYADFPEPIKKYNTYRMRAFGYWISTQGIPVINNVRWGTEESWSYCFDGIPVSAMVAIGVVGSGIKEVDNRELFDSGLLEMIKRIQPLVIIIYGSARYNSLKILSNSGIKVVSFPSKTNLSFQRSLNEQTK